MAGIYIHIPFCKQACYYCNFHFTTSLRRKNELIAALLSEISLRGNYLQGENIETIYFGGGTPSLLQISDLKLLIEKISSTFHIEPCAEITIEINPDDIDREKLKALKETSFNRLSMGIQSFFDEDLKWMNRAHSAKQALDNLQLARNHFDNISIDLIYGTPLLTNEKWQQNVERAIAFDIPHLSCYALTVEPKTPLYKMIRDHQKDDISPEKQSEQFLLLMEWMEASDYEHYEISNFARPYYRSQHNSSYWKGKKYLGIGPSAHSFDGSSREWNVSNNNIYIESICKGIIPSEKEILTPTQQLNEYIMTSLRTIEGLDLNHVRKVTSYELRVASKKFIERKLMKEENNHLKLTREGKLLADGIASDLFKIN
ncbi:MAG TPA: radical SAM family heme chaperone HemW [Chitinophagaceae bacterium]|nr:radical SAM family heme chaperone HemW [Chitinophagaceae bacterium]